VEKYFGSYICNVGTENSECVLNLVKCMDCSYVNRTFDFCLDLALNIDREKPKIVVPKKKKKEEKKPDDKKPEDDQDHHEEEKSTTSSDHSKKIIFNLTFRWGRRERSEKDC
jgi:hypothetical protein